MCKDWYGAPKPSGQSLNGYHQQRLDCDLLLVEVELADKPRVLWQIEVGRVGVILCLLSLGMVTC